MYDDNFYRTSRDGMANSARALVPLLRQWLGPIQTMVDVGCGQGWWAREFQREGVEALGIDGAYVRNPRCPFEAHDLTEPLNLGRTFDLALSLEVAEHLPEERADGFIADLCKLAPVVVFSAAIPGQGGTNHINEQWPEYWAEKFRANDFRVTGSFRNNIWDDDRIENWYRQNLLVADSRLAPYALIGEPVLSLVHPVLWESRL